MTIQGHKKFGIDRESAFGKRSENGDQYSQLQKSRALLPWSLAPAVQTKYYELQFPGSRDPESTFEKRQILLHLYEALSEMSINGRSDDSHREMAIHEKSINHNAISEDHVHDVSDTDDTDEEDWQDVDVDDVPESFVCLFDAEVFDSIAAMFKHCKSNHDFDIWKLQQDHDLDFLGLVRLVNYIRRSVASGDLNPTLTNKAMFEDDSYLLPVLESDAVLYNLEEILISSRTIETTETEDLQEQLLSLQARFDAYRTEVSAYLGKKFDSDDSQTDASGADMKPVPTIGNKDGDADYFHGYSFNAIHESMLKDQIRTDAYRDFIYSNKDLFKDKVVLDVGCGTGILSMFCAKAGAKEVIAVDNSDIIHTARAIIKANNLDHIIRCVKGKIEDVRLPIEKADIIVSEWMGYCLLFESMLDSVLFARDKYLVKGGLMVPSHATMSIGTIADSDIRESHIEFWNDVYGFNMQAMVGRASAECLIRTIEPADLSGTSATFKVLDLHTVRPEELTFDASFNLHPASIAQRLDGFTIWFDTFFARDEAQKIHDVDLETAKAQGIITLSTSPYTEATHWQQGICFIDQAQVLKDQTDISGKISLKKPERDARGLELTISYQYGDLAEKAQSWRLSIV